MLASCLLGIQFLLLYRQSKGIFYCLVYRSRMKSINRMKPELVVCRLQYFYPLSVYTITSMEKKRAKRSENKNLALSRETNMKRCRLQLHLRDAWKNLLWKLINIFLFAFIHRFFISLFHYRVHKVCSRFQDCWFLFSRVIPANFPVI